jgi:hypothetical protein
MELVKKFLENGMDLETSSIEEEIKIMLGLNSFFNKKSYMRTSVLNKTSMEVYLYEEHVCTIVIKDSTLRFFPCSENCFEVLVDCMEYFSRPQEIEEEDSEEPEDSEEQDEWI